jgi:hypothetical protein
MKSAAHNLVEVRAVPDDENATHHGDKRKTQPETVAPASAPPTVADGSEEE